jgi:hypothetical protein
MMSLSHIVKTLCPEHSFTEEKPQIKEKININCTNYNDSTPFLQVLHCLSSIDGQYEIIKNFALTNTFNPNIAIKKIVQSIEQHLVNKDILLFLSAYYNINLYVFNEQSKLLHVYYIEDNLDFSKNAKLLIFREDKYQSIITDEVLTNEIIPTILPNVLHIGMGLYFNKVINIGQNLEITPFVITPVVETSFINEFTLFDDTNLETINIDFFDTFLISITEYVSKLKKIKVVN